MSGFYIYTEQATRKILDLITETLNQSFLVFQLSLPDSSWQLVFNCRQSKESRGGGTGGGGGGWWVGCHGFPKI